MPAWPEPGKELHRLDFDYAFQPVLSEGRVYFGSSSDDMVRALDAATGALVWRFVAGGPIRLAPSVAGGRVFVASDDGWITCLDAGTGTVRWRFHAAQEGRKYIGNGRMISRWPCRTSVLPVGDTVYCTAGMWPTEGIYVYALDAATGMERWGNDSSGSLYVDLPHPVANGFSGVAP
jgi:outer membrane protein assembly factor BamB